MAGHSKWANIQHRKGRQDAKRGKLWTKIIREITVAARAGGPDPDSNPRLRMAWDKATDANMPKDNIQRAIQRGAGGADGEAYEEVRYEGYGIGGAAVIVDCMTDNRTRTVAEVRHAFAKNGGNLGASGAVSHGFERLGLIEYPGSVGDEDKVLEAAIEAGADDVESDMGDGDENPGLHQIWVSVDSLHEVARELEKTLGEAEGVKLAWKPTLKVDVDADTVGTLMKLVDTLEDDDDVQTVWGNYEISDEVMETLG